VVKSDGRRTRLDGVTLVALETRSDKEARIREIARWHTILGGRGDGSMEMKMENRLCELSLQVGEGEAPVTGYAYNERCFGTLW
jgi:hypothetical protein